MNDRPYFCCGRLPSEGHTQVCLDRQLEEPSALHDEAMDRFAELERRIGIPEPTLARRLGWMAEAMIAAKVGPQARFFTRDRVDEIVLLLREAEKALIQ